MTRGFIIGEAFARDVTRVAADSRPVTTESGVFAVFDGEEADAPFLGLVTPKEIASHPWRIFADLLSKNDGHTVVDDTSAEATLAKMEAAGTSALAVLDDEGHFVGAVTRESLSHYLLERERALVAEIRSREAQVRAILRALPHTMLCVGVDGTLLDLVRRDVAAGGDGAAATRLEEHFPAEVHAALLDAVRGCVTSGLAVVVPFSVQDGATQKDYESRVVRWSGRSALIVTRNTTELNVLRARVALADRMLAVGTLAAGVAHEINTPLTYVLLDLETLQKRLADKGEGADAAPRLAEMREGLLRIQTAVTDLMRVAQPNAPVRAHVDVRTVLESSLRLANHEIKHRARVTRDYGEVPLVEASEDALGEVILNLLLNAAHSIVEGAADRNEIRVTTRTDAEGRAVVEIRDSGCGMPDSVKARIFDPFFTTKPQGAGLGLGLSIGYGIVSSLGGVIEVETAVGRGSSFRVALPPAAPAAR